MGGALAGATSACVSHPVDTVKSNMMGLRRKQFKNSFDCLVKIFQEQGFRGVYAGLPPRIVRVILENALLFTLYDRIDKLLSRRHRF